MRGTAGLDRQPQLTGSSAEFIGSHWLQPRGLERLSRESWAVTCGTLRAPHKIQADLVAADSLVLLRGDTPAMINELRRRREQIGVSYILVNGDSMAQ
jgi:hypothetical protein